MTEGTNFLDYEETRDLDVDRIIYRHTNCLYTANGYTMDCEIQKKCKIFTLNPFLTK